MHTKQPIYSPTPKSTKDQLTDLLVRAAPFVQVAGTESSRTLYNEMKAACSQIKS